MMPIRQQAPHYHPLALPYSYPTPSESGLVMSQAYLRLTPVSIFLTSMFSSTPHFVCIYEQIILLIE